MAWSACSKDVILEPLGDGTFAVFNRRYWDATLLHPIDAALLTQLLSTDGSMRQDDLIRAVADGIEMDDEVAFHGYCRESLRQLAHIGLIRPATTH